MLCNDIFLPIIRVLMHPFPLIQLKTDVISELITSWIEHTTHVTLTTRFLT